jgi:hypothetical protein
LKYVSILNDGVEYVFNGNVINSAMKTQEDVNAILASSNGHPFVYVDNYQGVHPEMRRNPTQSLYFPFCKLYESLPNVNQVILLWEQSSDTTIVENITFNIFNQLVDSKLVWIQGSEKFLTTSAVSTVIQLSENLVGDPAATVSSASDTVVPPATTVANPPAVSTRSSAPDSVVLSSPITVASLTTTGLPALTGPALSSALQSSVSPAVSGPAAASTCSSAPNSVVLSSPITVASLTTGLPALTGPALSSALQSSASPAVSGPAAASSITLPAAIDLTGYSVGEENDDANADDDDDADNDAGYNDNTT